MKIDLVKELPQLVEAGLIDDATAKKIGQYYANRQENSGGSRMFILFAIIGSVLVGLGIILIIAHNWDMFSRPTRVVFAFLPVLLGQAFCFYTLLRKYSEPAWKESAAVFLFFAVGASISLVSQIYNIPGSFTGFMTAWMLLSLPLIYIMSSSMTSLLYLVGITTYAADAGYFDYPSQEPLLYWLMFVLILPYYYMLLKRNFRSNFASFHNWFIPLSVIIVFGSLADHFEELMFLAYLSLFGLLFSLGSFKEFSQLKLINNGLIVLGSLGSIILLIMLSYDWFWLEIDKKMFTTDGFFMSGESIAVLFSTLLASFMVWRRSRETDYKFDLKELVFLIFIPIYALGFVFPYISIFLVNLLLFVVGIYTINKGIRINHLGILNYGLLIVTALMVSRFFDADISFILRGILFVVVGAGFFVANYWFFKKRKSRSFNL